MRVPIIKSVKIKNPFPINNTVFLPNRSMKSTPDSKGANVNTILTINDNPFVK